jgi:hypothetical protein
MGKGNSVYREEIPGFRSPGLVPPERYGPGYLSSFQSTKNTFRCSKSTVQGLLKNLTDIHLVKKLPAVIKPETSVRKWTLS